MLKYRFRQLQDRRTGGGVRPQTLHLSRVGQLQFDPSRVYSNVKFTEFIGTCTQSPPSQNRLPNVRGSRMIHAASSREHLQENKSAWEYTLFTCERIPSELDGDVLPTSNLELGCP